MFNFNILIYIFLIIVLAIGLICFFVMMFLFQQKYSLWQMLLMSGLVGVSVSISIVLAIHFYHKHSSKQEVSKHLEQKNLDLVKYKSIFSIESFHAEYDVNIQQFIVNGAIRIQSSGQWNLTLIAFTPKESQGQSYLHNTLTKKTHLKTYNKGDFKFTIETDKVMDEYNRQKIKNLLRASSLVHFVVLLHEPNSYKQYGADEGLALTSLQSPDSPELLSYVSSKNYVLLHSPKIQPLKIKK